MLRRLVTAVWLNLAVGLLILGVALAILYFETA